MRRKPVQTVGALLWFAGAACAPSSANRSNEGCLALDIRRWAHKAWDSIRTRPSEVNQLFDLDARQGRIAFERDDPGREHTMRGEAAISFPYPDRFGGGSENAETMRSRSFTYDNALVSLARTAHGDREGSARILRTLASLQNPNGSWGFSFPVSGSGFYNASYVRAGTVAFAVYAFAKFASAFDDSQFRAVAGRGAEWLLHQRDLQTGLVLAGAGRWRDTSPHYDPAYQADFAATEHQIDSVFALAALGKADPEGPWGAAAAKLAHDTRTVLWIEREHRFAAGWSPRGLDTASALDASGAWGALLLQAMGRRAEARDALRFTEQHHRREAGRKGLRPYATGGPDTWFVEGSAGFALAAHRVGNAGSALAELRDLTALGCKRGVPLVYATEWNADFPFTPAIAPTIWYVFAAEETMGDAPPFLWSERVPSGPSPVN